MQKYQNKIAQGRDDYLLLDSGDVSTFARDNASMLHSRIRNDGRAWVGSTYDEFAKKVVAGDEELVASSEAFLAKIEDQVPMSRGWRNVDDVVGAIPNVPAFLAGHPQCMRRRERTMKETAPLAIYMDLTSSAGIGSSDVQKRGIVLLALTRLLVEHRPVELWVGTSLGSRGHSGTTAWRIDTAPLDLARAAFHIGATVMSRGFGYGLCRDLLKTDGHWPFDNYGKHCETAKQRIAFAFPGQELLYIPPIHLNDEMTTNPIGWVKRTMAEYVVREE